MSMLFLAVSAGSVAVSKSAEASPASTATANSTAFEAVSQRQGTIVAARRTRLVSRFDSIIKQVFVNVGDRFKQGDVLVEFDCSVERAALEEARLSHQLEKLKHNEGIKQAENKRIDEGSLEVLALQAEVALAHLNYLREKVEYCKITAPYDGRLVRVFSSQHEKVAALDPVADVIGNEGLEFHFFLPWEWRQRFVEGHRFNIRVGDRDYEASLQDVAIEADVVDRSFKAVAKFVEKEVDIPLGVAATVYFDAGGQ